MTRVIVMDLSRHNTVMVGHDRYFILQADGRRLLVRDYCPHRGGPLSLARRTPDGRRLSCPWHGTKVGVAAVQRTCLPMVLSGDEAVVLLPEGEDAPVSVIRKEVLANLPPDAPCADGTGGPNTRTTGAATGDAATTGTPCP
ncbi:Rieske (2Fe-2S) protein [Actinomadura xylanilytica]|uniref:Rieske (2Fe-2S) protein n=1 Tax=Actinomadura xylanilytica TaxID=887459 RepID=UPI00255AFC25|nr:Rieske 2Fe-2S domain-containing protein [Actinomadura xylanilytica]MDL4773906.1 Rieske 2Fe-2S domain-containing protein [Actinomadura xylanilytica]